MPSLPDRQVKCPACYRKFWSFNSMRDHWQKRHPPQQTSKPFCSMAHHEDNEEPELDCPFCGRGFSAFARLDEHMVEHEDPKKCRQCGETIRGTYHRCR